MRPYECRCGPAHGANVEPPVAAAESPADAAAERIPEALHERVHVPGERRCGKRF